MLVPFLQLTEKNITVNLCCVFTFKFWLRPEVAVTVKLGNSRPSACQSVRHFAPRMKITLCDISLTHLYAGRPTVWHHSDSSITIYCKEFPMQPKYGVCCLTSICPHGIRRKHISYHHIQYGHNAHWGMPKYGLIRMTSAIFIEYMGIKGLISVSQNIWSQMGHANAAMPK